MDGIGKKRPIFPKIRRRRGKRRKDNYMSVMTYIAKI